MHDVEISLVKFIYTYLIYDEYFTKNFILNFGETKYGPDVACNSESEYQGCEKIDALGKKLACT
jgi:hypothetical protein